MARTRAQWIPILDGAAADRARRVVLEIADVLRASDARLPFPDGPAARALFFGYLADAWPDDAWSELAGDCLGAATSQLAEEPMESSLFHGFVGTAWVVEHLQGHFLTPEDDDPLAAIDDALLETLTLSPSPHRYELMHGLTGFGIYAWERLHRPSGRAMLARVVERLDELALQRDGGTTWLTPRDDIHEDFRPEHPEGRFTLGAAHGIPAAITLLALACAAGIGRAQLVAEGAVAWLLAQRLDGASSRVPRTVDVKSGAAVPARVGWCYGDPGVGASLLWAARAVGNQVWADAALEMTAHAASRETSGAGVVDAGFCHGAVGNAQLFNRAYQATGDATLRAAALGWLDRALAFQTPGGPCAGFLAQNDTGPVEDESLLSGIAGIGLALLAATTNVEPEWDRLFASAVPPLRLVA